MVLAVAVLAAGPLVACGGGSTSGPVQMAQSTQARDLSPSVPSADATRLASDNQAFAVDLYQELRASAGDGSNLIFSPASVSIALAMLYNGAANATATQMATALHFTLPLDRLDAAFDALDLALTTPPADAGAFQLSVANSTWTQKGFSILPTYLDNLAVSFGSGVDQVDFVGAPETARTAVNSWVSKETQGEIPALFGQGTITSATRLVLADAVYFHGDWQAPFSANSANGTFHAPAGDVTVPMMYPNDQNNAVLWSDSGWSAASLGYQGGTTAMILVVPDAGTFDAFQQGLTADQLATILAGAGGSPGAVTMPRFTFSVGESLIPLLQALGMTDAFTPGSADLSGIDGATDLSVDAVIHQADIAVDEQGTTAAAATGVGIGTASVFLPPQQLTVDRPFLTFIVHQPTGAILFAGWVVDPTSAS
jgi:serpin B